MDIIALIEPIKRAPMRPEVWYTRDGIFGEKSPW